MEKQFLNGAKAYLITIFQLFIIKKTVPSTYKHYNNFLTLIQKNIPATLKTGLKSIKPGPHPKGIHTPTHPGINDIYDYVNLFP